MDYNPTLYDEEQYTAAYYPDKTPIQARTHIKSMLDLRNFAIAVSPFKSQELKAIAGSDANGDIKSQMAAYGIVHVKAVNTDSDYHYKVESGKPVCFEIKHGKYVTGINPDWGIDEYKIIGTALASVSSGSDLIPVLLQRYEKSTNASGSGGIALSWSGGFTARSGSQAGTGYITRQVLDKNTGFLSSSGSMILCYNMSSTVAGNKYIQFKFDESGNPWIDVNACF